VSRAQRSAAEALTIEYRSRAALRCRRGTATISAKAGKRADLIIVAIRDINFGVFDDPAHMVVTATQPGNVDTVVVDGRILKRGGKLTAMNAIGDVAGIRLHRHQVGALDDQMATRRQA
jgi:hypothetical protein